MNDLYDIAAEPTLRDPVLILALSGWVDAGAAGTEAAEALAGDGHEIVRFNGDQLFDYRSNRPVVSFRDGQMTDVRWPQIVIKHRTLPERDLLVMIGSEPDYQWHAFAEAVVDLMDHFGAGLIITIGSVPAAVPHTYPPPVMMTASSDELVGSDDVALSDDLDVPGAAVNIVAQAAVQRGMGTLGYWAQIPHYVNEAYPAGALALLRRIALRLGLELELEMTELLQRSNQQLAKINEAISNRPEGEAHVRKLEMMAEDGKLVTGDELAEEIESFLRDDTD